MSIGIKQATQDVLIIPILLQEEGEKDFIMTMESKTQAPATGNVAIATESRSLQS